MEVRARSGCACPTGLEIIIPGRWRGFRGVSPLRGIALIVAVRSRRDQPIGLGAGIMLAQQALRPD